VKAEQSRKRNLLLLRFPRFLLHLAPRLRILHATSRSQSISDARIPRFILEV
jgi:hypothetical protein